MKPGTAQAHGAGVFVGLAKLKLEATAFPILVETLVCLDCGHGAMFLVQIDFRH